MRRVRPLLVLACVLLAAGEARAGESFEDLDARLSPTGWRKLGRTERTRATRALTALRDTRAIGLLLSLQRPQGALARKLRDQWEDEEKAWARKTERFEKPVEKRRRENYRTGDTTYVEGATQAWLGSKSVTGAMFAEKDRIERLYRLVVAEERLADDLLAAAITVAGRQAGAARADALERIRRVADGLEPRSRARAVERLARLPDATLDPWLLELLAEDDAPVAAAAHRAVGRRRTPEGVRRLVAHLVHARWQVRAAALDGLASVRDAEAVDAMMDQAAKERGVLRSHYQRAFQRLFAGRRAANLPAWATWWKEHRDVYATAWQEGREVPAMASEDDQPEMEGSTSFYGIPTTSRHIIFVVDMSSSMKHAKTGRKARFAIAREELAKAIGTLYKRLPDDAGPGSFNIVVYGTFVEVYRRSMVVATPAEKRKALAWIEEVCIPVGKTNSFDALAAALELAEKANGRTPGYQAADTIFFMTDAGKPNRGMFMDIGLLVDEVARRGAGRYLTIHTIGIGASTDKTMLHDLAAQSGGRTIRR